MNKKLEKGLIHIYTGDGKGKTTAAVGQGVRTTGAGYNVMMIQFLKGRDTGEINSINKLAPNFKFMRLGDIKKFYPSLTEQEKEILQKEINDGIEAIKKIIESEQYNLIILDEIMGVLGNKIIAVEQVVNLLNKKPDHIEIILTGRNAPQELVKLADYVTDMKMIKHPFEKGIYARDGIE